MSAGEISHHMLDNGSRETAITAHLEARIVPGVNSVYCASFQLAWNELIDRIVDEPLRLEGDPLTAQMLNERLVGRGDIAEACYLAMAGFKRDGIVDRVRQGLEEKFERSPGLDLHLTSPSDILAYAYLQKSIPFDTEFEAFDDPLPFGDGVLVEAFGVEQPSTAADQVVILDYQHPDDFVIGLQASPEIDDLLEWGVRSDDRPRIAEEIILAKVRPRATLRETVEMVLARCSEEARRAAWMTASQMGKDPRRLLAPTLDQGLDVLWIPKIDLDVQHSYPDLVGKKWLNQGYTEYSITEAVQAVKFRMDETGADLKSEAMVMASLGIPDPAQSRAFIFDKPFLLCLKERQARFPYLAIWVDNSALLVEAKNTRAGSDHDEYLAC